MHQTGQKTFYKNCRRGLSTLQLKPKIKQPYCGGKIHPATTAKELSKCHHSNPTGHAVKRKRQDDETEYQYRKRLLANTQDNNEDDIADDPNI